MTWVNDKTILILGRTILLNVVIKEVIYTFYVFFLSTAVWPFKSYNVYNNLTCPASLPQWQDRAKLITKQHCFSLSTENGHLSKSSIFSLFPQSGVHCVVWWMNALLHNLFPSPYSERKLYRHSTLMYCVLFILVVFLQCGLPRWLLRCWDLCEYFPILLFFSTVFHTRSEGI